MDNKQVFTNDSLKYAEKMHALVQSAPEECVIRIWAHMRTGNLILVTMYKDPAVHEELLQRAFQNMLREAKTFRAEGARKERGGE